MSTSVYGLIKNTSETSVFKTPVKPTVAAAADRIVQEIRYDSFKEKNHHLKRPDFNNCLMEITPISIQF